MSFITTWSEGNFDSMTNISLDKTILLSRVLEIMQVTDLAGHHVPCEITAVTNDLERNTGGEKITYTNAVLTYGSGNKKAYHNRNGALNIKLLDSNQTRSINPILITRFNGQRVILD